MLPKTCSFVFYILQMTDLCFTCYQGVYCALNVIKWFMFPMLQRTSMSFTCNWKLIYFVHDTKECPTLLLFSINGLWFTCNPELSGSCFTCNQERSGSCFTYYEWLVYALHVTKRPAMGSTYCRRLVRVLHVGTCRPLARVQHNNYYDEASSIPLYGSNKSYF